MSPSAFRSRSKRRKSHSAAHAAEALEDKVLLSNVSIRVRGDRITIRGDRDANEIGMRVEDGVAYFQSLNGETINGGASEWETPLTGPARRISVNLNHGDDVFILAESDVAGRVNIKGGRGNDTIIIANSEIEGRLRIDTHRGDDNVAISFSEIDSDVRIKTSRGADKVMIEDETVIDGRLDIRTGRGNDNVLVVASEVSGRVRLDTGHDDDTTLFAADVGGDLRIKMGRGEDLTMAVMDDLGGRLDVDGGSDDDEFSLETFEGLAVTSRIRRVEVESTIVKTTGDEVPFETESRPEVDALFDCMASVFESHYALLEAIEEGGDE